MKKNGTAVKVDIAVLQEKVTRISDDVTEIKTNHIPHLHERLDTIELKMAYYVGGLAAVGFILQIVLKWLK